MLSSFTMQVSDKSSDLEQKIAVYQTSSLPAISSTSSGPNLNGTFVSDETGAAVRQRLSVHANELHDFYFSMRTQALIKAEEGDKSSDLNNFTTGNSIY